MTEREKESVYYLTRDEIKKIIVCSPSLRDRTIIKILARTGMRRGELRDLEVRDVDFDKRRIYIRSGKGDKSRTVPVDSDTLQDIKFYIGDRKEGKLITSNKQNTISLKQINEICAKCGRIAGVRHPNPGKKDITPHLFRHSFARIMLEKGMRMEEVQKMLGHSSIKTTIDVYGTPGIESVQKNYDKIIESIV
jgi:integrase/recombinase XerD